MIDEVSQVIKIISANKSQAAACPLHAVSSDLTRLRFGGAGGFPWQVRVLRVPRLSLAVQTTAHTPAGGVDANGRDQGHSQTNL
jgi:hypothetical protein